VTRQNKRQHLAIDAMGESMPTMVKARPGRLKKVKMVEVKLSQKSIMRYFSPKP
jgi:serine protease inhibitor ecotin